MQEYQKKYLAWKNSTALDAAARAELDGIAACEEEIKDRFYTDLAFGTGGMRGVLGIGTNRMNRYTVRAATLGYARFLKERAGESAALRGVVISHDNRRMSRELCLETAGVLAEQGIKAYIFEDLRPTPELSFAVRYLGAVGGVMITASHNPPEYNGYKAYDENGCQLLPDATDRLTALIAEIKDPLAVKALTPDEAGELIQTLPASLDEAYYDAVARIALRKVDASDLTVVYSPQHGTGNIPVRTVLGRFGYRVIPVEEQCTPDGDFSATQSPNPENAEAYELALAYAERTGADIAITTDPDCDRLGVVAKRNGAYCLMSGNQSGAVLLQYILSYHKEMGTLPQNAVMCNTVVTSTLGDAVCRSFGVEVEKTLTGFKFIGDKIEKYRQTGEKTYVFGYEESYGCLISDIARDKDAVQASLMLCEAAAYYKAQGKTLWDVLEDCYHRLGYYHDACNSVMHKGAEGAAKMAQMMQELRKAPPAVVAGIRVAELQDFMSGEMQQKGFPPSDVLRFVLEDGSFIAVRPSGTEPKCKYYYCVVGKDATEAAQKYAGMRAAFEK